ncbi:MAG: hypothetical protein R2844_02125 [Caldilineales bacterium]
MTQIWPEGMPIDVETAGEDPAAFRWQGGRQRVRSINEQWVVHDEWWRDEIWRRYLQIETADALLCVIYHDLLTDAWFLERLYD